jgi:hypothetical protein
MSDILSARLPIASPPAPLPAHMLAHIAAGLRAGIRRDEAKLADHARRGTAPGFCLSRRLAQARADLAELRGEA